MGQMCFSIIWSMDMDVFSPCRPRQPPVRDNTQDPPSPLTFGNELVRTARAMLLTYFCSDFCVARRQWSFVCSLCKEKVLGGS